MMTNVSHKEKKDCSGCSACKGVCPRKAIEMVEDKEGFLYPAVNTEECINCGMCVESCPFTKELVENGVKEAYVAKHKNKEVLLNSTSGGVFTALSDLVLNDGGVIYGAVFDEKMVVRHIRATSEEERNKMRGSKYVQSDMGNIFLDVKKDLEENRNVLFTGTPCQIAGLKAFLNGKDEGLICIDLICYGVSSPVIFKEHINFLERKKKEKVVDYKFRPKKWGWHNSKNIIIFDSGKEYYNGAYSNLYQSLYYSRIVARPSCNNCQYASLYRQGDISIGDCQGIERVKPDFDCFDGASLVIVNTKLGQVCLEKIKDRLILESLDINDALQPPLKAHGKESSYSERFYKNYFKLGYEKAIKQYFGKWFVVKYYIKKLLKK